MRITEKGLTTPLSRWLQVLDCLCSYSVTCASSPTGLIPWFSKTEGNTYATLLHHPFLFKGKPTQAQEIARRISGIVAREIFIKSSHTKYPSQTLLPCITLFSIRLSFSSPPLLKRFSKTFASSLTSSRMSFCLCFHVPSICLHLCLLKIYLYGST